MNIICTYIIAFIPILCFGQRDIFSVDSLANNQTKDYLNEDGAKFVLLYEFGCLGCGVEGNCNCDFGDTEIYIISNLNKISKFNCCESTHGELSHDINQLVKENTSTNKYFQNTFKVDYLESHSDFYRLELITIDSILSIEFSTYLFNEDYEFKEYNLSQSPKILVNSVIDIIGKDENIKWKKRK